MIVGTGLAGAKAAEALREAGSEGRVVLIGEEAHRPTIGRRFQGLPPWPTRAGRIFVHDESSYRKPEIELILDRAVVELNIHFAELKLAAAGSSAGAVIRRRPGPKAKA